MREARVGESVGTVITNASLARRRPPLRSEQSWQSLLNKRPDFVANAAVVCQLFFFCCCGPGELWRIVEPDMHDSTLVEKCGAILVSVATDRDHQVQRNIRQSGDELG